MHSDWLILLYNGGTKYKQKLFYCPRFTEISNIKLPKIWDNKPPKFTYSLLQTLFLVMEESSLDFGWYSFTCWPFKQFVRRMRSILQQSNDFFKKVNDGIKKHICNHLIYISSNEIYLITFL